MSANLTRNPVCIMQHGKAKSRWLADAVIAGCGQGRTHQGDIDLADIQAGETPVLIGVHSETVDTLWRLHAAKRPYVTIDNGYFRPYNDGGYFRATTNSMQWVGLERRRGDMLAGKERWDALDVEIRPWRFDLEGKPVMVALQSPAWFKMMRLPTNWTSAVIERLELAGAKVIVRHKPLKGAAPQSSLEQQLNEVSAVVAHSSATLLHAALAGVPVFPQAYCAATPFGVMALHCPNKPTRPERLPTLLDLANNQWTIDEIASGRMWADLNQRFEPEFVPFA